VSAFKDNYTATKTASAMIVEIAMKISKHTKKQLFLL
jgi:hypothetical protein